MEESDLYKQRRATIYKSFEDQSIAILVSADEQFRTNDIPYPYRQDSNFYYLTGFNEPNAIFLIHKIDKHNIIEHFFIKKWEEVSSKFCK